jgi:predicted dehydrogenase
MLRLKKDILNGEFGRPLRIKAIVLWPRDTKYFQRGWAGRKYTDDGLCVFDSIANNACAHYLHNMLFVLGGSMAESAMPQSVVAELYKANPIENFDTIALRMETRVCGDMIFLASHAVNDRRNPTFQYSFEKAELLSSDELTGGNVVAVFRDGRRVNYGAPSGEDTAKLWSSIDAVRTGTAPSCVAMTALPHTLCIDAIQRSVPDIPAFPKKMVHTGDNGVVYAEGVARTLWECYEASLLPSERAVPWAKAGLKYSL